MQPIATLALCVWMLTMSTPLQFELQAKAAYAHGKPVMIGFSLTNVASSHVSILKWYTPLEGINGRIFEVTCEGKEIPYEGRMVKRGNPTADDYIEIKPGDSVNVEFDLSRYYSLPECNHLLLKFNGRIHDFMLDRRQQPRAMEDHQSIDIPGNTASFRITP